MKTRLSKVKRFLKLFKHVDTKWVYVAYIGFLGIVLSVVFLVFFYRFFYEAVDPAQRLAVALSMGSFCFSSIALFIASSVKTVSSAVEGLENEVEELKAAVEKSFQMYSQLSNSAKLYITLGMEVERLKKKLNIYIVFLAAESAILCILSILIVQLLGEAP